MDKTRWVTTKFHRKFERTADYGYTALSENKIQGNVIILKKVQSTLVNDLGVMRSGEQNLICITTPKI